MKTLILSTLALSLCTFTAAHAASDIIFSDSFENDTTGYNEPDSGSTPAWNAPVAGMAGETALTQVRYAPSTSSYYIPGQDGNQYMVINTSAAGSEPVETDLITTVNGDAGKFEANTNYTLSVSMAQENFGGDGSPGNLFNGILALRDGTTGATLDSVSHNFGAGDADFHTYTFQFNTATDPGIVGDYIQIGLEASSSAGSFQDSVEFDKVSLSLPEPSTWAMLLVGLGISACAMRRRVA